MNKNINRVFGSLVRRHRERCRLSQAELARKVGRPQPTVSRLERGQRSADLLELRSLAKAFNTSVSELLADLEGSLGKSGNDSPSNPNESTRGLSPIFHTALADQDIAVSQLAAYGVRFMDRIVRPAVFRVSLEEALLAALKHFRDSRVFEAVPSLLIQHAGTLDWNRLVSNAFVFQLQNMLGAAVSAALQLKKCSNYPDKTWETLQAVHNELARARLDREEVLGPKPKTEEALRFLEKRTPPWMHSWHVLGSVDIDSLRRWLPQ